MRTFSHLLFGRRFLPPARVGSPPRHIVGWVGSSSHAPTGGLGDPLLPLPGPGRSALRALEQVPRARADLSASLRAFSL